MLVDMKLEVVVIPVTDVDRAKNFYAGLGVYERGADGLLTAARAYDDVQPPPELSGRGRLRH